MNNSLYQHLQDYHTRGVYPFHMPGHKRNAAFLPRDLLSLDMTEFGDMDNLHAPEGVIKNAQAYAAAIYGADESFFLVNGSSSGIMAAVCAVCGDGDVISVARNTHVSVFNALVSSGASPVYIMPEIAPDGLPCGILPEKIPGGFHAVIITSPTYEGYIPDIKSIAEMTHRQGGVLIVDEAHGAHFPFHSSFPATALEMGADIVVNSFHKTLPALSQCAVLHVRGSHVNRDKLRYYLKAVQTTSPSYIFMASVDYMLHLLHEQPAYFDGYVKRLAGLRRTLPDMDAKDCAVRLTGRERIGTAGIKDMDMGKLLFDTRAVLTGREIAEIMASSYRVQMEMADERHFLAMTSVADTDEGFKRLSKTVSLLNRALPPSFGERPPLPALPKPSVVLRPREAIRLKCETVDWPRALGQIAGEFITPYPPGIPLLAPGERITAEVMEAAAANSLLNGGIKIISRR